MLMAVTCGHRHLIWPFQVKRNFGRGPTITALELREASNARTDIINPLRTALWAGFSFEHLISKYPSGNSLVA